MKPHFLLLLSFTFLVVFVIQISCSTPKSRAYAKQKETDFTLTGKVVAIESGDHLTLKKDGELYQVRFFGIDCPEPGQPFSLEAKQFIAGQVFEQTVKIKLSQNLSQDTPRNIEGWVLTKSGENLNERLLVAGLAWNIPNLEHPKQEEWENFQTQAKKGKIGLWRDKNPMAPWEYRHRQERMRNELTSSTSDNDPPIEIEIHGDKTRIKRPKAKTPYIPQQKPYAPSNKGKESDMDLIRGARTNPI